MKTQDQARWTAQEVEFRKTEDGRRVLAFMVFWLEAAELMIEQDHLSVVAATRSAFELAEKQYGYVEMDIVAQMFLVIANHWGHGDDLGDQVSVFERKVVGEALARKIAFMQEQAAKGDNMAMEDLPQQEEKDDRIV